MIQLGPDALSVNVNPLPLYDYGAYRCSCEPDGAGGTSHCAACMAHARRYHQPTQRSKSGPTGYTPYRCKWTPTDEQAAAYTAGKAIETLAQETGLDRKTIRAGLKHVGIYTPRSFPRVLTVQTERGLEPVPDTMTAEYRHSLNGYRGLYFHCCGKHFTSQAGASSHLRTHGLPYADACMRVGKLVQGVYSTQREKG